MNNCRFFLQLFLEHHQTKVQKVRHKISHGRDKNFKKSTSFSMIKKKKQIVTFMSVAHDRTSFHWHTKPKPSLLFSIT